MVRKFFKKSKFNFVQYGSKLHKDNVWDLENLKTSILKYFWAILTKNFIFKKKFSKFPKWPLKNEKICIFYSKNFKKFKSLELSYIAQNCIKTIFRCKRSQEKRFLVIFCYFWTKKVFWQKKSKKSYKTFKMSIFDL